MTRSPIRRHWRCPNCKFEVVSFTTYYKHNKAWSGHGEHHKAWQESANAIAISSL